MANLVETPQYDAGVYQIETTDPVLGGPNGVTNAPLKNLANRTAYLKQQVDLKAPIASPAFTGVPTVPDAPAGTNTAQAINAKFVQAAIAALVNSSPAALDTLNELAAALGNDANFAASMTAALAAKAPLNSPALAGTPTAPTPALGDRTQKIATMAAFANEFTALKAANGWARLPNGVIIQWGITGTFPADSTQYQIAFPLAFPTEVRSVVLTDFALGNYAAVPKVAEIAFGYFKASQYQVQGVLASHSYFFLAIGY